MWHDFIFNFLANNTFITKMYAHHVSYEANKNSNAIGYMSFAP